MADDIVTRLVEWQDHKDGGAKSYPLYLALGDAADEIQRLRHELGTVHADFAAIDELRTAGIERWHRMVNEIADWLREIGYPYDWNSFIKPPPPFRSFIEESWVRDEGCEWDSDIAEGIRDCVALEGGWTRG